MPGIINLHTHLGNTKGLVNDPKNYTRENLTAHLQTLANYGVTSVISMGSDQEVVLTVRDEQRKDDKPKVTRVFTAYRGFTGPSGYPTTAPGMKGVPFEVSKVEEVEKAVKELADRKVDLVKIWVDDHLGKEKKISMEMCKAIIENGHKYNLKVGAHIFYLEDAKKLVGYGLDAILHSVRDKPVDDEFIKLMKEKGAWQAAATLTREMSTFVYAKPAPFLDDPFFTRSVSKETIDTLKSEASMKKVADSHDAKVFPGFTDTAKKNLKKLVDSGVKYAFGSDTGGAANRFFGYFEHWEMELMAEAGLTPMQIITSFSKNSAEFLGAKKLGTIEDGHWADFVVLAKNPLEDIKNTRTIEQVFIAGQKVNQ
jgi:imidazolonepropionase-like amidohydrolase